MRNKIKRILSVLIAFGIVMASTISYFNNVVTAVSNYMLHIKNENLDSEDDVLFQNAALQAGVEYTVSFKHNFIQGELNDGVYFCVFGNRSDNGKNWKDKFRLSYLSSSSSSKKKFTTKKEENLEATYTFTLNSAEIDDSGIFSVGFYIYGCGSKPNMVTEFYIGDMILYASADSEKTNLLSNKFDTANMEGWYSNWENAANGATSFSQQDYTATLLKYDNKIFYDSGHYMLHVVNDGSTSQNLAQNVQLEEGKTYIAKFKYKFVVGGLNESVYFIVGGRQQSGDSVKDYYISNDSGQKKFNSVSESTQDWVEITFTFTHKQTSGIYGVGFKFEEYDRKTEMYIADYTVYESNDTEQKNLLTSVGNSPIMYGWYSMWSSAGEKAKEFKYAGYTAKYEDYDESLFVYVPPIVYPKQMCYFSNGSGWTAFVQSIEANVGDTLYFEFSLASNAVVRVSGLINGARNDFEFNAPIIEKTEYENYYHAVAKIVVPEETPGGIPMTDKIFVGVNLPSKATGYIFDISCYKADDPDKTELLSNPDFQVGLDDWAFGWSAWFVNLPKWNGRDGKRSWSNDTNALELMDFDEKKLISYTDDRYFNDGEWWSKEDVADEEVPGKANILGKIINYSDSSIFGMKLELVSEKYKYSAVLDSEGSYSFKNVFSDFYELYFQNSDGELISTGYYSNINDGETITLDLNYGCVDMPNDTMADVSDETTYIEDDTELPEPPEQDTGSLNGGVYSADLKPISGIKIYLRDVGFTTTDNKGQFEFDNIPVGTYEIYTVNSDCSEYILKNVEIKTNVKLSTKLKYDYKVAPEENTYNVWLFIVIGAVIIVVGGIIVTIVLIRKKRRV